MSCRIFDSKLDIKYIFLYLFLMGSLGSHAQFWIAGDTSDLVRISLEESFEANEGIVFDIDCDGIPDFRIFSSGAVDQYWPWKRLSFGMEEGVQVLNSGIGKVSTFEVGDTLYFSDSLWTAHLDFIFGTGEAGSYGQPEIDKKYIAFRKNAADTSCCFLNFSSRDIRFTVHEIISECARNPLSISKGGGPETLKVYPNPFLDELFLQGKDVVALKLYSVEGNCVFQKTEPGETVNLGALSSGLYLLELLTPEGRKVIKILKQ